MGRPVKECLRPLTTREEQELQRTVKAKSERVDAVRRAKALLWVTAGGTLSAAGQQAGMSREGVSKVVRRFNLRGLDVLETAAGRGRKVTYTSIQRAGILAHVQQQPDRQEDGTATWSLSTLQQALRSTDLPHIAKETIRQVLHEAGYSYQQTRTWCRTGYALRKRKSGTVLVYDLETLEKTRLIELACSQAEADGVIQLNEDEAGPYQAIPQPGASWQPEGHPVLHPAFRTSEEAPRNCSPSFVQPLVSCAPKVSCLLLMSSCIPGSSSSSRRCWPTSRRHTREQNCRLTKSALRAHAGRRGWAIYHTIPSLPYASCWC
jgi:transposase